MLTRLQTIVHTIRENQRRLDEVRAERAAAADRYERSIDILQKRIRKLEELREEDPKVRELTAADIDLQFALAQQEEQAGDLALEAFWAGAFGDKKTVALDGATVQVRELTRRTIADPVAFLDQVREAGLQDKLVKSIKVSVNTADFNKWCDLVEPDSVEIQTEARAYVRLA